MSDTAERIVLSYPENLSDWGRTQVAESSFRAFLRKTREEARPGDVWEEFVGVGCCGDTLDVPLRVEAVDGSPTIDADTAIEFVERNERTVDGGWRVQSGAGP